MIIDIGTWRLILEANIDPQSESHSGEFIFEAIRGDSESDERRTSGVVSSMFIRRKLVGRWCSNY